MTGGITTGSTNISTSTSSKLELRKKNGKKYTKKQYTQEYAAYNVDIDTLRNFIRDTSGFKEEKGQHVDAILFDVDPVNGNFYVNIIGRNIDIKKHPCKYYMVLQAALFLSRFRRHKDNANIKFETLIDYSEHKEALRDAIYQAQIEFNQKLEKHKKDIRANDSTIKDAELNAKAVEATKELLWVTTTFKFEESLGPAFKKYDTQYDRIGDSGITAHFLHGTGLNNAHLSNAYSQLIRMSLALSEQFSNLMTTSDGTDIEKSSLDSLKQYFEQLTFNEKRYRKLRRAVREHGTRPECKLIDLSKQNSAKKP